MRDCYMGTVKCIGILTSGGDAPGMNAAIRAVTRAAIYNGLQVKGIYRGYKGLVTGEIKEFKSQNVSNIIQLGGTILKTARCKEFTTPEGRQLAYDNMKKEGIDALVIIGGDGSLTGARIFAQEFDVPCIGLPGTIDNDLYGTDMSFGFQSAIDIASNTIDCIHTTAASHSRVFIVELMGHKTGWLTLYAGIAGGADIILIPEIPYKMESIINAISKRTQEGKHFTIIAVAEGAISQEEALLTKKKLKELRASEAGKYPSVAYKIGDKITELCGHEVRVTVPGHVQRGGQPNAYDRVLATRLGVKAAELIMAGKYGYMPCVKNNQIDIIPISEVAGKTRKVDPQSDVVLQARQLGLCLGD